ncbi:MAG: selenide, water dikinase SelD [Desulfohalobiaceae bacterium]|nr:selenide, water dikinase SelD [Desulfohalobiaceae bacterium]
MCGLHIPTDSNVLVGLDRADDAGVYKISEEIALIQTVDFFTPIVDEPYWFGQIAAANALSDVYAMGGIPKTAMNLVGFPVKTMDMSVLREMLQGGLDKLKEADVVLVGGHSVEDNELKYGLSVTGLVHPQRVITKQNMRPADRLILTKPLGTGIVNTALKGGLAGKELVQRVTLLMAQLNRIAAEVMADFEVHACTDVTGFGLLGHLAEMVVDSGLGVELEAARIPLIPEALEFASMGIIPAGSYKNKEFRAAAIDIKAGVGQAVQDLLYDPQTSGGLLISLDAGEAEELLRALQARGLTDSAVIGRVVAEHPDRIRVY